MATFASPAMGQTVRDTAVRTPTECRAVEGSIVPPPPSNARLPVVEPVVCEEELEREVPPLGPDDPELQRPLETVIEFERRLLGGLGAGASATPSCSPSAPMAQI